MSNRHLLEMRARLEQLDLEEESLFRERQTLVHRAIERGESEGVASKYHSLREREMDVRAELLEIRNQLDPGYAGKELVGKIARENRLRKWVLILMMGASAIGLFWVWLTRLR